MTAVRERKHRLSSTLYRGRTIVSFTACIAARVNFFNRMDVFLHLSQMLLESLKRQNCDAHVYLFMPDHCHFLIQGNKDDSDLLKFMKDFKQRSGYWFSIRNLEPSTGSRSLQAAQSNATSRLRLPIAQAKACDYRGAQSRQAVAAPVKWQKDFHDHILRKEEDIKKQVRYILLNPVRKELIDHWQDYPFKGSTLYNFEEWQY